MFTWNSYYLGWKSRSRFVLGGQDLDSLKSRETFRVWSCSSIMIWATWIDSEVKAFWKSWRKEAASAGTLPSTLTLLSPLKFRIFISALISESQLLMVMPCLGCAHYRCRQSQHSGSTWLQSGRSACSRRGYWPSRKLKYLNVGGDRCCVSCSNQLSAHHGISEHKRILGFLIFNPCLLQKSHLRRHEEDLMDALQWQTHFLWTPCLDRHRGAERTPTCPRHPTAPDLWTVAFRV